MRRLNGRDVLLLRLDDGDRLRVSGLLRSAGASVHHGPWDENTADLVYGTPFDAVVAGFPVSGPALSAFLRAVRASGSGCRRAGVVLLAAEGHEREAAPFVGRGVNRVVSRAEVELRLVPTLDELLSVATRHPIRAPTRVTIHITGRALKAFCQTENVSVSGMLLKGFGHHPVGTSLDFELSLPGETAPIRGAAEVRRATNTTVERVEGVGARFLSFATGDRFRLESFLARAAS